MVDFDDDSRITTNGDNKKCWTIIVCELNKLSTDCMTTMCECVCSVHTRVRIKGSFEMIGHDVSKLNSDDDDDEE